MNDYIISQIRNAQKNPVYFNMTSYYTVNNVSAKLVVTKTSGNTKRQVNATLPVLADSSKLSPYVILNHETMLKKQLPRGIVVRCQPKGYKGSNGRCVKMGNAGL